MRGVLGRRAAHRLQISILLAAIGIGAALLGPLKAEADRRADTLKNRFIGQLEENLNITIGYESISPALLSAVTVRNLRVDFEGGSFVADKVRVFYNPLSGKGKRKLNPARMISRISVDEGRLDVFLPDLEFAEQGKKDGDSFDPWPLLLDKTVILTNFTAAVDIGGRTSAVAEDVSLSLKAKDDEVRYVLKSSIQIDDDGLNENLGVIGAKIDSDGVFSPSGGDINGRIDVGEFHTDVVRILPLSVDFTYAEGEATIRRIDDHSPIDLSAKYSGDVWEVACETENLRIDDIVLPGEKKAGLAPWFSSVMNGTLSLSGNSDFSELRYSADVAVDIPEEPSPWPLTASLKIDGDKKTVRVNRFNADSLWGEASYKGTIGLNGIAPEGALNVVLNEDVLGYPLRAEFLLETQGKTISARPLEFEAAGMEFHDFSFLIVYGEGTYALSLNAVPAMPEDDAPRRILIDALLDAGAKPVVHGFASVEGFEAAHIARFAGISGVDGLPLVQNSRCDISAFFEANGQSWVLSVEDALIVDKEKANNVVRLSGRAYPGNWRIDSLRMSWNDYVVDGKISAQGNSRTGLFDGRFVVEESLFALNGKWHEDGRIDIDSNFGLSASFGEKKLRGRSVKITGDDISVPLKDGYLVADVDARGQINKEDWYLYLDSLDLKMTSRASIGDLSFSARGTINPGNLVLPLIALKDDLGELKGNAVVAIEESGRELKGKIFLNGSEGENYNLSLSRNNDIWDIGIGIASAELARFQRERLSGRIDINGRMSGSLDNPKITLGFKAEDGYLDGKQFNAEGKAVMESRRLRVYDITFKHEGVALERGLAIADLNEGNLRSTAEINANFNQVPVSTGFSLALDFRKGLNPSDFFGMEALNYTGTLATRSVIWDSKPHLPPFTFQFTKDDEAFRIKNPNGRILDIVYLFDSGRLDVFSADPLPIAVKGGGIVSDGRMDLSFPDLEMDPILINYVMKRDPILLQYYVVFQGGRFIGNLDLIGPTGDPDLYGKLRAQDLIVDTPYTYAEILPTSSDIIFNGNNITFDRLQVSVGKGIVYGYGHINIDRWSLTDFDMHYGGMATSKGEGVPIYYPLFGLFIDGLFTGDIHMTGNGKKYFLDGELTFPYLKAWLGDTPTPVNQRKVGKYPAPVFLDLDLITGNNCTFYLPNEQFKIVRATAESGKRLSFIYSTDPKNLSLTGVLPIKNGEIFYFDRDFQVTEGEMRFNENLIEFDPVLSFRAETKVRDDEGDDVTVALVYNAPVGTDFQPSIETEPKRSETEILALFGQAVVPYAESRETDAGTVLLATGGMFGQVGIVQPFEDVLREGLNLDMVSIQTDIIENTLAEGLTRSGSTNSSSTTSGLGRYLDNTSLFVGKYIGNSLFLSSSLTASYLEGQRLRSIFGELEFETSVSLEMETPFFNVAWSYSPDSTKDRNFIDNNEISLKWQFAY